MKKIIPILLAFLMPTLFLLTSCGESGSETTGDNENTQEKENTNESVGKHHAEIVIRDYGTITVELDGDAAPLTVTNFISLAKSGFYDGLTFHRIMEGFMMQGGAGKDNSVDPIKGEFVQNGVNNPLSHTRGAISMARTSVFDSATSQFFICHEDSTFLDGAYACFGYVTDGIDVVDAVCENSHPTDNNGTIPEDEQPVIEKITILD